MRSSRFALLLLIATAGAALRPAPAAGYAYISWDPGDLNLGYEAQFDCASDAGTHGLVARFTTPTVYEVDEIEAVIDYCSGAEPLPEWWRFDVTHRQSALTVTAAFDPGPYTLTDYWQGRAQASLTWEQTGFNMARIVVHAHMTPGSGSEVLPDTEYLAFRLNIAHTGTLSNSGCDIGVCLVLNDLRLIGPGVDFRQHYSGQGFTYWQGGVPGCPFIVPVEPTTWSGLKALYR